MGTGQAYGVSGFTASTTNGAAGLLGVASAVSGVTYGMWGRSHSTDGVGVRGEATDTTANTGDALGRSAGVKGRADGPLGTGVFGEANNTLGFGVFGLAGAGAGLTGRAGQAGVAGYSANGRGLLGGTESGTAVQARTFCTNCTNVSLYTGYTGSTGSDLVYQVDASGNVRASSYGDLAGNPVISPAALVRGITLLVGCETCGLLTDADDQPNFYFNVVWPMTVNEVRCFSDAGTPTINLRRDDGSPANVLSSDLSCSILGPSTSSFSGTENILNLNDKLDFVMVSAGGVAKRITVAIKATLN